jgi:hypothetical protein
LPVFMDLLDALKGEGKNYFSFSTTATTPMPGRLPDPELFFTWYCERARDIERSSGSCEAAIELLDSALVKLAGGRSLARRFITATRHSLLRYRAHLASLANRLSNKEVSAEEKGKLLDAIRSADWGEFEQQRNRPEVKAETEVVITAEQSLLQESDETASVIDWSVELSVLDAILRESWAEAINLASQSTPFPFLPEGEEARRWLERYCQVLQEELGSFKQQQPGNLRIIPASLCNDPWSEVVEGQVGCALTAADEDEQVISLLTLKSALATNLLKKNK